MKIYKFGGASVKDSHGIRRISEIIAREGKNLVVVISAMGKTTNALEDLLNAWFFNTGKPLDKYNKVYDYHREIMEELFPQLDHPAYQKIHFLFDSLEEKIRRSPSVNYDYEYDQLVSYGEMLSTTMISEYLKSCGINNTWLDVRELLATDSNFRFAAIDWDKSAKNCAVKINPSKPEIFITQGFLGSDKKGNTTTLGREGSDFTAAALANILNAESVTVWKDVAGVLNADPTWKTNAALLPEISYFEAVELAFFGAKVIHPKTIKPVQNKNIPLFVKSFLHPDELGTMIMDFDRHLNLPSIYIRKTNQVLVSISPKDFSFILEHNLSHIFQILAKHNIRVNLMQNTAVSFSVCFDYDERTFPKIQDELITEYNLKYNLNLELITIRHYTSESMAEITSGRKIYIEERSRKTARFVLG